MTDTAATRALIDFANEVIQNRDYYEVRAYGARSQVTNLIVELRDAVALALPPSTGSARAEEWRPIADAPKDGTPFDAWVPTRFGGHRMTGLSFNRRGELRQHGTLTKAELPRWPTHFMPLPAPPSKGSGE